MWTTGIFLLRQLDFLERPCKGFLSKSYIQNDSSFYSGHYETAPCGELVTLPRDIHPSIHPPYLLPPALTVAYPS